MSLNLLEMAKTYLTDDVVAKISGTLSESTGTTTTVLGGALPTILGGLINKTAEPGGANLIMDMITKGGHNGAMLDNMRNLVGDSAQTNTLLESGTGILSGIFGDKVSGIISALASFSGMRESSASSLMSMAAPILLGILGKQVAADGLGASGLTNMLGSQKDSVAAAMPAGLGSLLGNIPGLGALGGLATSGLAGVSSQTDAFKNKATQAPANISGQLSDALEDSPNGGGFSFGKLLPWLLLGLVGFTIWFFTKGCNNPKNSPTAMADSVTVVIDSTAVGVVGAASGITNSIDSAANATAGKLGAFFKRKLPTGLELNIPENGIENKLITFIEDNSKAVDKKTWFDFDRLQFETGKSILKPTSREQLDNIVAILKAYSAVEIKLGGYTDNTGNAKANLALSAARASSVMAEITKAGVSKNRLTSEGYGDQFPVATNNTSEGREQNRRVSVRVTKK